MLYNDLNLKINKGSKKIIINEKEVEVLQYLPIQDKIDLIEISLQKSEQRGIYNEMKLDMYFSLYIVFSYTNLEFTDEQKQNLTELYDELESNNVFVRVINAIPDEEYDLLYEWLKTTKEENSKYNNNVAALLRTFIQDMPKNAQAAAEIMQNFDMNKYKQVISFAEKANAGRVIPMQ